MDLEMGHFHPYTGLDYLEIHMVLSKSYRFYFFDLCLENEDPKFTLYIWEVNKYKLNFIW